MADERTHAFDAKLQGIEQRRNAAEEAGIGNFEEGQQVVDQRLTEKRKRRTAQAASQRDKDAAHLQLIMDRAADQVSTSVEEKQLVALAREQKAAARLAAQKRDEQARIAKAAAMRSERQLKAESVCASKREADAKLREETERRQAIAVAQHEKRKHEMQQLATTRRLATAQCSQLREKLVDKQLAAPGRGACSHAP